MNRFRGSLLLAFISIWSLMGCLSFFLDGLDRKANLAEQRSVLVQMEEVLHRVRRNGRPELLGKTAIDQALFRINRGDEMSGSLEKASRELLGETQFFLFNRDAVPLPIGKAPPKKTAVWQKLMQSILANRFQDKPPTVSEEKLAGQLLNDRVAIPIISRSRGHFRKLADHTLYTFGGWWQLKANSARPGSHLLAFLKAGLSGKDRLLKQAVLQAQRLCRGRFSVGLIGRRGAGSEQRLPREIRAVLGRAQAGKGRFQTSSFQGTVVPVDESLRLVAWQRKPAGKSGFPYVRGGTFLGACAASLLFLHLFLFGSVQTLSLRLLVPGLILLATLPPLGFLLFIATEVRQKMFEKEVYESHRFIEDTLKEIDSGFTRSLGGVAGFWRKFLDQAFAGETPVSPGHDSGNRFSDGLFSAYLFRSDGKINRVIRAPPGNQSADRKLIEGLAGKLMKSVFGPFVGDSFEDTFFAFYLVHLGEIIETMVLDDIRLRLVDLRLRGPDSKEVLGMTTTYRREPLIRTYLAGLARDPRLRGGIQLALVSVDEGSLVQALPRAFLHHRDGMRLCEQVLESGKTLDAIVSDGRGRRSIATAFLGRALNGFILIGAMPLADLESRDTRLQIFTMMISCLVILLAIAISGFLADWIRNSLQVLRQGATDILANRYDLALPLSGADEFSHLARGIEKAASTLEEVYSSHPVHQILARCDQIPGGVFFLDSFFEPARNPGGDYMDAFAAGENRFVLAMGGVLAEGWQTTLVTAGIRMSVRLLLQNQEMSMSEAVQRMDGNFRRIRGSLSHMTLLLGVLHTDRGVLECASAGHEGPMLIRNGEISWLRQSSFPIGMKHFRPVSILVQELLPGDLVVFFSNGWTKALDSSGSLLGYGLFKGALKKVSSESPQRVIERLQVEIRRMGYLPFEQVDHSMLVLRCPAGEMKGETRN